MAHFKYAFSVFLFSLVFPLACYANVPIVEYSPVEYDAGIQNWSIAVQTNGWVYAANNYGLLEYDGGRWQLYGVWGGAPLRSVAIGPDGRIFVGSTNEFGFFESDNLGKLVYQSLSVKLPDHQYFGEIWNISFLNNQVSFQSSNDVFIFDSSADTLLSVVHRDEHIFCSYSVNNGLYLATTSGVYALVGNSLNLLRGSELLRGYEVRSMASLSSNSFLIATDLGGLFLYNGNHIIPYKTSIDSFLSKNQVYTFAIRDSLIAIGTVSDGIVVLNTLNSDVTYINRSVGLQNNTVLSLVFDAQGYLWAGLDQGLSHVYLGYPIVHIFENEKSVGAGYSVASFGGKTYFGTNQGVYVSANNSVDFLEGSQGQVWNFGVMDGHLLCFHHRGLYEIVGSRLVPLSEDQGFWNIHSIDDRLAVVGSYNGLYLLSSSNHLSLTKIEGFDETAYNFQIDKSNNLWFNGVDGIYRIILDGNNAIVDTVISKVESIAGMYILKYDDQVLITSSHACWRVADGGVLEDAAAFFEPYAGVGLYYSIMRDKKGNEWFMMPNDLYIRSAETLVSELVIRDNHFFIDGFYFMNETESGSIIFGGVDGFYSIDGALLLQADNFMPEKVYIREMLSTNRGDSLIYGESYPIVPNDIVLDYADNSLRFRFAGDLFAQCEYSLCLEPLESDFSPWTTLNIKEYTSLREGKYLMRVRMRPIGTDHVVETALAFRVRPPWYRHWLAILFYIIAVLALIYMVYRYFNDRLARKYQQESFEKEKRILELEKERTASELRHKSQEMSNLLLSQVNRQEILQDIQADLYKISDALVANNVSVVKQKLQALLEKISKHSSTDIDWSKFEENFDVVNDNFLTKLTAKYPTLNKNERKLCVYIRMGLYNKEIAPLLNISTRGVEMLRYRMRRKMNLGREENLEQMLLLL